MVCSSPFSVVLIDNAIVCHLRTREALRECEIFENGLKRTSQFGNALKLQPRNQKKTENLPFRSDLGASAATSFQKSSFALLSLLRN